MSCEECGCLSLDKMLVEHFQVRVCSNCAYLPQYKLISKGAAKSTYLVSDADLKRLNCIKKPNPHKQQWADMLLYLTCQVAAIAQSKHGNVRHAQHQRMEDRIKSRLGKRSAEPEDEHDVHEEGRQRPMNPGQEKVRRRILSEYGQQQQQQEDGKAAGVPAGVNTEEI